MTISVRSGDFDVAVVAGPRIHEWPSVGVRTLSRICTDVGLRVGLLGGRDLWGKGLLPLPGSGGIVFIQDAQRRIHRIEAKAVVRVTEPLHLPDPFEGWRSQGLVPYFTAARLLEEGKVTWKPATVILGSGNRAFRFASELLERELSIDVYCLESVSQWGAKSYRGWEVERRRFEMLGGKLIHAELISLRRKNALVWELKLKDEVGIRLIDAARVVSVGPFSPDRGIKEHPPGSLLFDLEHLAPFEKDKDIQGWIEEEEQGRAIGLKIAKIIGTKKKRGQIESESRRSKAGTKQVEAHHTFPFEFQYEGKWMSPETHTRLREFPGVPNEAQKKRLIASLECFESIACRICEEACPDGAIQIERGSPGKFLIENKCTGCGACVEACPSRAAVMLQEAEDTGTARLVLPQMGARGFEKGELAQLLNREGKSLGSARVSKVEGTGNPRIELEVPEHLVWEARAVKRKRSTAVDDDSYLVGLYDSEGSEPIEITLDGERRLVRENLLVSMALFEIGHSRPEDTLLCPDGSCGQCDVLVDGIKQLGCQVRTRPGMVIKLQERLGPMDADASALCPCLGIRSGDVQKILKKGGFRSPDGVMMATRVGQGRCGGQFCVGAFRRLLMREGFDTNQWIPWKFPWGKWQV